jgi:hypothetical protein
MMGRLKSDHVGILSAGVSQLFGIACSASQFEKRIAELTAELDQ